ncbi:SDR family oxidoreductase [Pseudomonas syringae]|uniref:SDR family oxidoreductase n=1 Tax=Pseudomonas syringae TaxID=317 RepID=UPI0006E64A3B|nr:SDR family oxidoreductase [Pseudomonas syringae]KPY72630.1 hypothetical protein ALO45_200245 [Pseudomonas syringae pv. syringae]
MHIVATDRPPKASQLPVAMMIGLMTACSMLPGFGSAGIAEAQEPSRRSERDETMSTDKPIVLVVGASGSIGQPAVAESLRRGYQTRALVRDPSQAKLFAEGVEVVVGDLTRPETLDEAVAGVTGVIFTHGISGNNAKDAEAVNYGAVRNVLSALKAPARIALMTTVGVTKPSVGHDWKRRGERLVRASGLPYTIVRPGWFDYNAANQQQLVMRQGDTHWAGSSSDGVVSRKQIAQVLVSSLSSPAATRKTFELVAERGAAQTDLEPLFSALPADPSGGHDAFGDRDNLPAAQEPGSVVQTIEAMKNTFAQ